MSSVRRWCAALVVTLAVAACAMALQQTWAIIEEANRNQAIVDRELTSGVLDQASTSVERLWSYDYRRLGRLQRVLGDVGTASFQRDYGSAYDTVRRLAPERRAVVTATVREGAVSTLTKGRAVVLVFVNQRTGEGDDSGARLQVELVSSSGMWKISRITPL